MLQYLVKFHMSTPQRRQPLRTIPEAVDMWKKLLGIAEGKSMGELDRAAQQGGRVLPRVMSDNMVDTLRHG